MAFRRNGTPEATVIKVSSSCQPGSVSSPQSMGRMSDEQQSYINGQIPVPDEELGHEHPGRIGD